MPDDRDHYKRQRRRRFAQDETDAAEEDLHEGYSQQDAPVPAIAAKCGYRTCAPTGARSSMRSVSPPSSIEEILFTCPECRNFLRNNPECSEGLEEIGHLE